jgi:LysM repeat protein
MPRLTHICLGMCSASLLVLGIVTLPMRVSAAPGDPQNGPSSYSSGSQYGSQQDYSQAYGGQQSQYGQQDNSQQYGGPQQYGSQDNSQQYGGQQSQYGSQDNSQQYGGQQSQYGNSQGGQQYGGGNSSCSDIHQIAAGENLSTIADSYGVSADALADANNIDDPNVIIIGEALCIPGGHSDYGHGDSNNSEYGQQSSSYGNTYSGSQGNPGHSYDPSQYSNSGPSNSEYGSNNSEYGQQQGPSYDNSQYSDHNDSYGHNDSYSHNDSYGSQGSVSPINFCPEQDSYYMGTPGQSYDPSKGYPSYNNSNSYDNSGYNNNSYSNSNSYNNSGYNNNSYNNSYAHCEPIIHLTATSESPTAPTTEMLQPAEVFQLPGLALVLRLHG